MLVNITLLLFASMMLWAAASDIRYYILSNKLCLAVALLYPIFIATLYFNGTPLTITYVGYSVGISFVIFIALVALFALGLLGGGDVKFIPVVILWAGPTHSIQFLLITAISGGVISMIFLSIFYIKSLNATKSSEKINFSVPMSTISKNEENNIPYGVAISIGGLYVAFEIYKALN